MVATSAIAIRAAEGGFQIGLLCVPEVISELAHDGDIGPGKAVYRLPVIADGKELRVRRLIQQRLQQSRSSGRYVLELVDEDVAETD